MGSSWSKESSASSHLPQLTRYCLYREPFWTRNVQNYLFVNGWKFLLTPILYVYKCQILILQLGPSIYSWILFWGLNTSNHYLVPHFRTWPIFTPTKSITISKWRAMLEPIELFSLLIIITLYFMPIHDNHCDSVQDLFSWMKTSLPDPFSACLDIKWHVHVDANHILRE